MRSGYESWGCSACRAEGVGRSHQCVKISEGREWRRGSQTLLGTALTGQEETAVNLNIWNPIWSWNFYIFFSAVRILNGGTGCPEILWSLCLWRYPRAVWTQSWVSGGGWTRRPLKIPSSFNHILILWKGVVCCKFFDGLKANFRFILGIHTKFCCWTTHSLCWITHS